MSRWHGHRSGVPRLTACALALGALAACTPGQPAAPIVVTDASEHGRLHGTDIGDVIGRPALALPDAAGRRFDLRRRPAGELTVLFFGYTHCPDLCPTTMADLAAARRLLPPTERARMQVVFVTEDPGRDTPQTLRAWLARFDRSFIGLVGGNRGSAQALTALKASRTELVSPHAVAASGPARPGAHPGTSPAKPRTGAVEHSGSVYAFVGDRVVVYTGGTTPGEYADDFRALLNA